MCWGFFPYRHINDVQLMCTILYLTKERQDAEREEKAKKERREERNSMGKELRMALLKFQNNS